MPHGSRRLKCSHLWGAAWALCPSIGGFEIRLCPGWEQQKLETPQWGKETWPEKEQWDFVKLVNEVAELVKEPVLHLKIDALVGRFIRQQMPGFCRRLESEQGGGSEPAK